MPIQPKIIPLLEHAEAEWRVLREYNVPLAAALRGPRQCRRATIYMSYGGEAVMV
jgi:hypothetical protein